MAQFQDSQQPPSLGLANTAYTHELGFVDPRQLVQRTKGIQ
jgi:hypothetical protein